MDSVLQLLMWPSLHLIACAMPMIIVHNGPMLHRIMSDRFKRLALQTLPVAVVLAAAASLVHSTSLAMGAAVMSTHMQWFALHALYRRFETSHGRPPLTMVERDSQDRHQTADVAFGAASSMTVLGVPVVAVMICMWLAKRLSLT